MRCPCSQRHGAEGHESAAIGMESCVTLPSKKGARNYMKTSSFLTPVVNFLAKPLPVFLNSSRTAFCCKNLVAVGKKNAASAYT